MTATLGRMRTALLVVSVGVLLLATSACSSSSTGGDDVSAEAREWLLRKTAERLYFN